MSWTRTTATTFLVVIVAILVGCLDCNPLLFLYDAVVARSSSSSSPSVMMSKNKTIWITGASSGIGAALVCELWGNVDHIVLSSRSMEQMQAVAASCQKQEQQEKKQTEIVPQRTTTTTTFSVVYYNALDLESIPNVVEQAVASTPHQRIDVLVLNAGLYQVEPALETSPQQSRDIMTINFQSPVELSLEWIKTSRKQQQQQQHQHLVVVSSIMAKGPNALSSTYAASKAAMKNYFQTLSVEEWTSKSSSLRVQMILPGATRTNMWHHTYTSNTNNNNDDNIAKEEIHPDEGTLMSASRVARLMVTAMTATGPLSWFLFYEVWITKPVGLLYCYLSHYAPTLFYYTNHLVGIARKHAYQHDHLDMLELLPILKYLWWQEFWPRLLSLFSNNNQ